MNEKLMKQYMTVKKNYNKCREDIFDIKDDLQKLDECDIKSTNFSETTTKIIRQSDKNLNKMILRDKLEKKLNYNYALKKSYKYEMDILKEEIEEQIESTRGKDKTELQIFYYYHVTKHRTLEEISSLLSLSFSYIREVHSKILKNIQK